MVLVLLGEDDFVVFLTEEAATRERLLSQPRERARKERDDSLDGVHRTVD